MLVVTLAFWLYLLVVMNMTNDFSAYNLILWKSDGNIIHYPDWFLNFNHLEEPFDYVLFLKLDTQPEIPEMVRSLDAVFLTDPNAFVLITPWKASPLLKESADEFIYSFSCNFNLFKEMLFTYGKSEFYSATFLFDILDYILLGKSGFNKIFARQLPFQNNPVLTVNPCAVIIPHKGNNNHLKALMFFLKQLNNLNVYVGIDQSVTNEMLELRKENSRAFFFAFEPYPVGPYIIRNKLIEESKDKLICFQDSDDIPCADRFTKLSDFVTANNCQFCGSYEIRMDFETKTLRAIRFPTDVMDALAKSAGHSLLYPTSMITRDAFYRNGKLSEERIFGNDTKFLYHSFFLLNRIQNIPEFLYIRRIRSGSLTSSAETGLASRIRSDLLITWVREFDRVKNGMVKLQNTSLVYIAPSITPYTRKF